MSERITENIVRTHFHNDSLYKDNKVIIEEQVSKNIKINKLLSHASKEGEGKGYPEFIVQYKQSPDLIIVVECKEKVTQHESDTRKKHKGYAVDGVLLYASFLSKEYDVIAIAVSGDESDLMVSHFLHLKGSQEPCDIFKDDSLLSLEDYYQGYKKDERKFNQDFQELLKYSRTLNDSLHALKVKESERSLLISGTLIALTDEAFVNSYKYEPAEELAKLLVAKIGAKLSSVQSDYIKDIISSFSFITTHTILAKEDGKLRGIIDSIDEKINSFIKTYKYFDTLGQFYIEFLRYANNDKGLGIVLTPPHITELFCDIGNINKDSVVLDTCTGTGGFLISAMKKMIIDAGGDKAKEKEIKDRQIVGVELQHDIYSLLCANMYIHGDGRSNLMKGDCYDKDIKDQVEKFKPNVGFLNPPYKTNRNDREELEFVLNNLEQLEKGSYCVAIIPMSCAIADGDNKQQAILKGKILKSHTLEAVFSMPNELFYNSNVTVATCVCVFRAKESHRDNHETYFATWSDDGFIKVKNIGRADQNNCWHNIKEGWITNYRNKNNVLGHSIKKSVGCDDEWCSEAHIDIDYSDIEKSVFRAYVHRYVSDLFALEKIDSVSNKSHINQNISLGEFRYFNLTGDEGIFEIQKGERLNKVDRNEGKVPLLTSTSLRNGIADFIDKDYFSEDKKLFSNKITIDMLSNVFYHGYEYFSDDNVHTLIFKEEYREYDNTFVCLFIASLLQKIKVRFQYGRQVRLKRLATEKISLPIDAHKKPDWKLMETYIKSLPYSSNL